MGRSSEAESLDNPGIMQSSTAEQLRRIANLLALLATKGEAQAEKVLTLTAAGFTTSEVAALLRVKSNTVSVAVYQSKRKQKNTRKRGAPRRL